MKEIIVPTNLHCESCVTKLGKVLNADPRIHHWKADVTKAEKPVTVHGNLNRNELVDLLEKAGFSADAAPDMACEMPSQHPVKKKAGFWWDGKIWKKASLNTLNCLLGCIIGDFAMLIYLQVYYPATPMWLQMVLAMLAGLVTSIALETVLLRYREKFAWKNALRLALSMSLLSIAGMEVVMNATDFMITGGKAQLDSFMYWFAFIPAALAGFLAPLPYNYYQLKKHNKSHH